MSTAVTPLFKPFTLGKYEGTRTRAAIAELIANGGAPMGVYTRFTNAAARKVITQYYNFIRQHDAIYRHNQSAAKSVLLYPRTAVHAGNVAAVKEFLKLGDSMLDRHILFDILPDDLATPEVTAKYEAVFRVGKPEPPSPEHFSITAPKTVRVSLSRPAKGDATHLHFVNYNRIEPTNPKSAGGGIHDEKPIAVKGVQCSMEIPKGRKLKKIRFLTPENKAVQELTSTIKDQRAQFTVPEFLVYGVLELKFQ